MGGGLGLEVLRDAPLVGIDALDDAGAAQRLQPTNMSVHEPVIVAAGHAAIEARLLQMAARPVDAVLGYACDGAVGRARPRVGRADLDDAADPGVRHLRLIDAGDVMRATVNAVDHQRQLLAQLVGEMLVHHAADDRRRGRDVVKLEAHRIAIVALGTHGLLHGADDVATLAHLAPRRLQPVAQFPDAGCLFGSKAHLFQFVETAQSQRSILLAPRIIGRVAQIERAAFGLVQHRPIDAGEAVLVDFGRQFAALLDLGDGAEFQSRQLARPFTDAVGEVIAVDDQILADVVAAVDDDMDVRMTGVEVVDRHPIQLRAEVGFELAHQVAGMAG